MFPCTSYTANTLHMGWREGGSVGVWAGLNREREGGSVGWSEQREGGRECGLV